MYIHSQVVKDSHLLVAVGVFLLVDTILLVTWNVINPSHWILITVPPDVGTHFSVYAVADPECARGGGVSHILAENRGVSFTLFKKCMKIQYFHQ